MHPGTKKVIALALSISLAMIVGSFFYYRSVNKAEDPRILPAKQLYLVYDKQLDSDNPVQALSLLEQILAIYRTTPGYQQSYEIGVLLNDQAAVYLVELETAILNGEAIEADRLAAQLDRAEAHAARAMAVYDRWQQEFGSLSREQLRTRLKPFFNPDDSVFDGVDPERVLEKRVEAVLTAQSEISRRRSVCLTNLGMINRYRGNLEAARDQYRAALELWDRNYTARDNLAILTNQPIPKRSLLSRLFPPERDE